MTNTPYGGKLVNRVIPNEKIGDALREAERLFKIVIDEETITDVKNIARGVYSPLEGFMCKDAFLPVLETMRLKNGLVWSIPVILDVDESVAQKIVLGQKVALVDSNQKPIALMVVEDKYTFDKKMLEDDEFGTESNEHPGIKKVESMKPVLVGGKIDLIDNSKEPYPYLNFTPQETRAAFDARGWKKIVAFQTRNPPHRGHEYLLKCALEVCEGLFIDPVIGKKKSGDFNDDLIIRSHQINLEHYFPSNRVFMAILPYTMKYAGPREAIFHAIIRKNFGCTHFIIGRDHAGVGHFYGSFDAQKLLDQYADEIGIVPLDFENSFYCKKCVGIETYKTCPHKDEDRIFPSGTWVREMVKDKKRPPEEIMRPEIADLIINWEKPYVE